MNAFEHRRMTRSQFLAAGAGAALGAYLPRGVARGGGMPGPSDLRKVEHVVIFMQENISFDHYFGTLAGVRGFSDPEALRLPGGRSVFQQPDPAAPDGYLTPWRFDTSTSNPCTVLVDNGWESRHAAWNNGAMDGFVTATAGAPNHFTMAYYERDDVPWHMALADAFTVCDAYYSSVIGPTNPNRYYMWTGWIDPRGTGGGPAIDNDGRRYAWKTYPERLTEAGVSWRVYHEEDDFDDNVLKYFAQYQDAKPGSPLYENAMVNRPGDAFMKDVAADRLPQVSWIVAPEAASEHPGSSAPGLGADYSNRVLQAFADNPEVWAKTALIYTYDEDGGYFDHVPPPVPPPGTADEFVGGAPIGLGFRVPTVVCSPWTRGGYVCSQTYDHTSLIRFLERRFGVMEPQISEWRRKTCGDLWECFDFAQPDTSFPALPSTSSGAARTADACANHAVALPPVVNASVPAQEAGTRPRRPCATPSVAILIPLTRHRGRRLLSGRVTVEGRAPRALTARELRLRRVVVRGLATGATAQIHVKLRVRENGHVRTLHVRRSVSARCPSSPNGD